MFAGQTWQSERPDLARVLDWAALWSTPLADVRARFDLALEAAAAPTLTSLAA